MKQERGKVVRIEDARIGKGLNLPPPIIIKRLERIIDAATKDNSPERRPRSAWFDLE